jgi:hypothetical protein
VTTLMQASQQWASRPADERYVSLYAMRKYMTRRRERSRATVESTRALTVLPDQSDPKRRGLFLGVERGPLAGQQLAPTHQAFGQICSLAATPSPASYFRESRLPAPIIADALNHNLRFTREVEDVGVLATLGDEDNGLGVPAGSELRAATGPAYGRIWDADIVDALVERFGDGVSGHWRVPGEFGNRITVTKQNTTLFASDRDMFVFLADEDRRIEVPDRRNGSGGSMARGFFVWNSEVGDKTLGLGFFLFDYVCCNRIVWGADQYTEVRIRHTKGAPDRWLEEVAPVLKEYDEGSAQPVMQAIEAAREKRVQDDLDAFLAQRFGRSMVEPLKAIHQVEEERPIETLWDVTVAATAHARSIPNNDKRMEIERAAGALLKAA